MSHQIIWRKIKDKLDNQTRKNGIVHLDLEKNKNPNKQVRSVVYASQAEIDCVKQSHSDGLIGYESWFEYSSGAITLRNIDMEAIRDHYGIVEKVLEKEGFFNKIPIIGKLFSK